MYQATNTADANTITPAQYQPRSASLVAESAGVGSATPELRISNAAAQTRIVSKARIRRDSRKSVRSFKEIICGDVSEFESCMPSHAVSLRAIALGLERPAEDGISLRGTSSVLMPLGRASFG
jgi:hypothetical protein